MPDPAILITGATGGLGHSVAMHLAAPGRRLLLHSRSASGAALDLASAVRERGAEPVLLHADLANSDDRDRMMDAVYAATPHLTALINAAGVYLEADLQNVTPAQWQQVFDSTCSAVFHITQRAIPLLRAGAPARVVNLGDSGADRVIARMQATPYHIAKLGVSVLTRSFAKLLTSDGITVNQISPGFLENSVGEPGTAIPAGRPGRFEDILAALDFLLSDAAEYTSGANIVVSGGWNL